MMNSVNLIGRLTKETELRKTQNGVSVVSFILAVNRTFKKEGQPEADFVNCVAWNHSADFMSKHLNKGSLIGIEGRIETRNYEDKTGKTVYVTEVVCNSVQSLESKKSREHSYQSEYDIDYDVKENEISGPTLDISSDMLPF